MVYYKGYISGIARQKRCIGQGIGMVGAKLGDPVRARHPPRVPVCSVALKLPESCFRVFMTQSPAPLLSL